jgi:hypothetical protein
MAFDIVPVSETKHKPLSSPDGERDFYNKELAD